jgi:hypothetical protein
MTGLFFSFYFPQVAISQNSDIQFADSIIFLKYT